MKENKTPDIEPEEVRVADWEQHKEDIDRLGNLAPANKQPRLVQYKVTVDEEVEPAPQTGRNRNGPNETITDAHPYLYLALDKQLQERGPGKGWMNYREVRTYIDDEWRTIIRFVPDPAARAFRELEDRIEELEDEVEKLKREREWDEAPTTTDGDQADGGADRSHRVAKGDHETLCPACGSQLWDGQTCGFCRHGTQSHGLA